VLERFDNLINCTFVFIITIFKNLKIDSTDTIDNVYEKVKEFLDKLLHKTSNQTDTISSNEQEETLDKKDFQNLVYVLGNYSLI